MDLEIVPKVFVLCYEYSEEDDGIVSVFNSYSAANGLLKLLESSALKAHVFIRFYIDVYEVLNSFNQDQVSIFEHLILKV